MKILRHYGILWLTGIMSLMQLQAASANKPEKNPAEQVPALLSSVPLPELPAKAASLVSQAKNKDKADVAIAAVNFTATTRPASISAVVSSLVGVLPGSAPEIAGAAAKLLPTLASAIANAAIGAAPSMAPKIQDALAPFLPPTPKDSGSPNADSDNGDRGKHLGQDKDKDHPGSIRGNKPAVPPGHVRDPKPGRDDNARRHYGSP